MIFHKTADDATVIADVVGKGGDWKMALVNVKGGWVIIAAGEWIVEDNSVCFTIMANGDSIE